MSTTDFETGFENDALTGQMLTRRRFLKLAAGVGGTALALSQWRLANAATKATASAASKTAGTGGSGKKAVPANHPMHTFNAQETIAARTFPNLSTVEGISQNQLSQHVELYNGYVKRINEIDGLIKATPQDVLDKANSAYNPYRELHVEQSYALNGVVLHEYYFENLGGTTGRAPADAPTFQKVVGEEFGSWDNYVKHLVAVGKSMRGWALTGYNMRDHRVHNYGLDLHNQTVPMDVIPLLVLDVYEHAYMIDFGTKRAAYLEAFMRNVNWAVVEDRLRVMLLHG